MSGRAAGEQKKASFGGPLTAHVVRPKRMHSGVIASEPYFTGSACTRQSLVFATPFADANTCEWIYRIPANPGNAEGRRPAAHPGLGPWVGARVASPRCPILRPGDLSVAGNTLIGQFPSPRSGPDAWQRSAPAAVSSWTCWHPRPAQVTPATSRCELTVFRDDRPCRGQKATAGIAPRQSPSSRRSGPSVIQGKTTSATVFLQQIIDRKILPDQGQAATQGVRGLLGRQPFDSAVADAIVLAEVTVHCLETVVGLARRQMWLLTLSVTFPTNNSFMSQSRSGVVEGGTARDDGVGEALMLAQHVSDRSIAGVEQLGEVAVGE